ncbi:hypothetical protein T439DRAFT_322212, partial [Meredithblackwellia eburnea MCA 4105]
MACVTNYGTQTYLQTLFGTQLSYSTAFATSSIVITTTYPSLLPPETRTLGGGSFTTVNGVVSTIKPNDVQTLAGYTVTFTTETTIITTIPTQTFTYTSSGATATVTSFSTFPTQTSCPANSPTTVPPTTTTPTTTTPTTQPTTSTTLSSSASSAASAASSATSAGASSSAGGANGQSGTLSYVATGSSSGSGPFNTGKPAPSSGLSTGAKAGIGAAAGVLALALLSLLILFIHKKRRSSSHSDSDSLHATDPYPDKFVPASLSPPTTTTVPGGSSAMSQTSAGDAYSDPVMQRMSQGPIAQGGYDSASQYYSPVPTHLGYDDYSQGGLMSGPSSSNSANFAPIPLGAAAANVNAPDGIRGGPLPVNNVVGSEDGGFVPGRGLQMAGSQGVMTREEEDARAEMRRREEQARLWD